MSGSAAASTMMTDGDLASIVMSSSGRKRPMRSTPSVTSDAFTQYRDINEKDELGIGGSGGDTSPCKKPRYPSSSHDHCSVATEETWPASASAFTDSGCAATVSPSVHTGGETSTGIASSDAFTGQLGASISSARPSSDNVHVGGNDTVPTSASADSGVPSVDNSTDNHAAEVAASRLEAQIDDLTSDMDHWCLTDLKGWRRRRAAVAAAASASVVVAAETSKSKEDGTGSCNVANNDINLMGSPMTLKGPYVSPRKDAPDEGSRSPSVPNSPSEKKFLRQRRREARRSMLRGIASSARRKLEV